MTTSVLAEDDTPDDDGRSNLARDVAVVAMVLAGFAAARLLTGVPVAVGLVPAVVGVVAVQPRLILVGVFLLIGVRAGHELSELQPAQTRPIAAVEVEVISDPRPSESTWWAQVDLDSDRLILSARTSAAGALRTAAAGDTLIVSGTVRGERPQTSWGTSRRLVGRLPATTVSGIDRADGLLGAANSTRDTIRSGASSLSADRRVLFTGLVFGDDREQNPIVADNFRASGLGHLLAVSGQNVVFVLLLAAPLLKRIRSIPGRVVASTAVLVWFGFLTRFEPSVTRALVMAGMALLAHAVGRPADASAVLPPAVLGLLLLDPLLAWSLAFQLSVAATAGLIVLTPRIASQLPGPLLVRLPVAATVGAQLAVAPLLLATFGRISIVAVPANLLAAPAAAGVMMWGLVVGGVAGLAPEVVAMVLHLPTRLMLWWIDGVASIASQLPVGHFGTIHLVVVVVFGLLHSCRAVLLANTGVQRLAGGFVLLAIALPLVAPRDLPVGDHRFASGVMVARGHGGHDVVILPAGTRVADALEDLRGARLGRIDLLITPDGSRSAGRAVRLLSTRFEITEIWAPPDHEVPGARAMAAFRGEVGTLVVDTDEQGAVFVVSAPRATR